MKASSAASTPSASQSGNISSSATSFSGTLWWTTTAGCDPRYESIVSPRSKKPPGPASAETTALMGSPAPGDPSGRSLVRAPLMDRITASLARVMPT